MFSILLVFLTSGIRYAQPPINELRFKAPQLYQEQEGVYDVSKESHVVCPQQGGFGPPGSQLGKIQGQEDCLLLNIYVPDTIFVDAPQSKLPVMVWIHGGAFKLGSNNYNRLGPQHFVTKDVIVISVNYRLGPLGFLSLGSEEVPGNAGLRDQLMALTWVKENIENFGGDPDSVTFFGESAGSRSINFHILSPLGNGLFQRY